MIKRMVVISILVALLQAQAIQAQQQPCQQSPMTQGCFIAAAVSLPETQATVYAMQQGYGPNQTVWYAHTVGIVDEIVNGEGPYSYIYDNAFANQ